MYVDSVSESSVSAADGSVDLFERWIVKMELTSVIVLKELPVSLKSVLRDRIEREESYSRHIWY